MRRCCILTRGASTNAGLVQAISTAEVHSNVRAANFHLSETAKKRLGRALAGVLLLLGLYGSYNFTFRTADSLEVVRSAYQVGLPAAGSIRGWMSLGSISNTYGVSVDVLTKALDLPADTSPDTLISTIAENKDEQLNQIIRLAQKALAESGTAHGQSIEEFVEERGGKTMSALIDFSYFALALIMFVGAMGAPVPTSLVAVFAGVLIIDNEMNWPIAILTTVAASALGDAAGFGIGRLAGKHFVSRYGYLFGYSGTRRERVEKLFERWGGLTVLLSRTLVSELSSVTSVLAGISNYRLTPFLIYAVIGRVIWTVAYLAAGFYAGAFIEASLELLENIAGLAISVGVAVMSAYYLFRRRRDQAAVASGS